jgi:hypothetical protein
MGCIRIKMVSLNWSRIAPHVTATLPLTTGHKVKAYILRNVPDPIWHFIKSQAALKGLNINDYLIRLMAEIEERTTGKQG